MSLPKKILYSIASVSLFSTQLLASVPIAKADSNVSNIAKNENTLSNNSVVIEGTNVTVKPTTTENNLTTRNVEANPINNINVITGSLENDNANKNEITITKKCNIKITLAGKFKLSNAEDLTNIVLFTPLTDEFLPSLNDDQLASLKVVIPTNQVTATIEAELASVMPNTSTNAWENDSNTKDITPLGKIKNQNGVISWGINNANVAKSLQNLDYKTTLSATFTPTNQTALSTRINSYLILNTEVSKSPDQTIIYKSQNSNNNINTSNTNTTNTNNDQSNTTNKPVSDEINTARKNAYRIVEKNKNLTDDQKNAFESLIDKSITIDQINAIAALATSITNNNSNNSNGSSNSSNGLTSGSNGSSSSSNGLTTGSVSKDSLTITRQIYQNEINRLSKLDDRQKALYSMLIDTTESKLIMDKIVEVARMQDNEQQSSKKEDLNINGTSTNLNSSNNNKDNLNSKNNLNSGSNNGHKSESEKNTNDLNNKDIGQTLNGTKDNNSTNPNANEIQDTTNTKSNKDTGTTTFSGRSSDAESSSRTNDPNRVLAQQNGDGVQKMAQTGVKRESFFHWLSNLFK